MGVGKTSNGTYKWPTLTAGKWFEVILTQPNSYIHVFQVPQLSSANAWGSPVLNSFQSRQSCLHIPFSHHLWRHVDSVEGLSWTKMTTRMTLQAQGLALTFKPCVDSAHTFTWAACLAYSTFAWQLIIHEMQFDNTQNISALKMYFQTFLRWMCFMKLICNVLQGS